VACREKWFADTSAHLESRPLTTPQTEQVSAAALSPFGVFGTELSSFPLTGVLWTQDAPQYVLYLSPGLSKYPDSQNIGNASTAGTFEDAPFSYAGTVKLLTRVRNLRPEAGLGFLALPIAGSDVRAPLPRRMHPYFPWFVRAPRRSPHRRRSYPAM
jgi:hypothetical protein